MKAAPVLEYYRSLPPLVRIPLDLDTKGEPMPPTSAGNGLYLCTRTGERGRDVTVGKMKVRLTSVSPWE